jgi:hypothetical protein
MNHTFSNSSTIHKFSHNARTKVLTVDFHTDRTSNTGKRAAQTPRSGQSRYKFAGVSTTVATYFATADSAGRFFNLNIKPNFKVVK